MPGQMENCAKCGKRFTVTPYSRADPDGGLLCTPCGKELAADEKVPKKKKPRVSNGPVGNRRKVQSSILDGINPTGTRSLTMLCVEHLAKNIDLAEDLGNLPTGVIDKIARILSKRRILNPQTMYLFLQPDTREVIYYDAARLSSDDIMQTMRSAPDLTNLKIKNGIQFKDEVMDYMMSRDFQLQKFYLHGANLLSDEKWIEYLSKKGKHLQSLRVYWTDKHVTDNMMEQLQDYCPSLKALKIAHNQQVSGKGVKTLANLPNLEYLSLELQKAVHPDVYVEILSKIGLQLKTFSLSIVPDVDNTVLDAIHHHCRSLRKLRITESEHCTDEGFARLFTGWENPGLEFLDLEKCRQLDSDQPRSNEKNVGLCSNGFRALMAHSGQTLRRLNVHACRHISREAFEDVFAEDQRYTKLEEMEISFCEEVNDFIVGCIYRCCPNLRILNIFGCMLVKDVRVPKGKILVGLPNAKGMQIEGMDDD